MKFIKNPIFVVFVVIAVIQLSIPASIIFRGERLIQNGREFKFITEPVDPNDPFRGKYISLRFKASEFNIYDTIIHESNTPVFVSIENDENGYAQISDISINPPADNSDYVKARIRYIKSDSLIRTAIIEYPFNRYYMEESKSGAAEMIYRQSLTDRAKITYALVNIKNGSAVLKDVMINDISLKALVKKK